MSKEISTETIREIAGDLDLGMRCFYDKTTGEVVTYPKDLEFSDLEDEWEADVSKVEANPGNFCEFKEMDSSQAFTLMESFAKKIDDTNIARKFIQVLSQKKPFANFDALISNYPQLRQAWFAYKDKEMLAFVQEQAVAFKEYETTIKESFNMLFCAELAYRLTNAFLGSDNPDFNEYWCDGIAMPHYDKQLSREHVFAKKTIETNAWFGTDGQEKYEMLIKLGARSIKQCKDGGSLSDCLPAVTSLKWVYLDLEKKILEVQLK